MVSLIVALMILFNLSKSRYVNQNQFFRQIRNFIFDMRDMPLSTAEHDQPLVPTGIHWQVAQAVSAKQQMISQ